MNKLVIYYDKECTDFANSFYLQKLNNVNNNIFFKKSKYWTQNKLLSENLIEYGEYILDKIKDFRKKDFNLDLLYLFMLNKEPNFNIKIVVANIYSKQYQLLYDYINSYKINFIDKNKCEFYQEFKYYLINLHNSLENYIYNGIFVSNDDLIEITQNDFDEIKSFGYFCLKYGDLGFIGIYFKN
jgi:hypothetical protein